MQLSDVDLLADSLVAGRSPRGQFDLLRRRGTTHVGRPSPTAPASGRSPGMRTSWRSPATRPPTPPSGAAPSSTTRPTRRWRSCA